MYSTIGIIIFINLVLYFERVNSKINNIKVLLKEPDKVEENYFDINKLSTITNEFFKNNTSVRDVNIEYSYCRHRIINSKLKSNSRYINYLNDTSYVNYSNCIIKELQSNTYDMMILDDRFLFSDQSLIENFNIEKLFNARKIHQYYEDLIDYIKQEDLIHHDSDILYDGYFDNRLYGIPYEFDYDLLYYKMDGKKKKSINETTKWESLSKNLKLHIPLGDNEELLKMFVEYIKTEDNSPVDFTIKFREYILSLENFNSLLISDIEKSFNEFINNYNVIYKGKASYYPYMISKRLITDVKLPPSQYSVVNQKYLIINKNSCVNKDILMKVALQLTSKEMQIIRAETFGSIPTFDFGQKLNDVDIARYCEQYSKICSLSEIVRQVRIKDTFCRNEISAPFIETRLLFPTILRNYLIDGKREPVHLVYSNIFKAKMTTLDTFDTYTSLLFGFMTLYAIISFIMMRKVYKYREHPHMKVISPSLSILVIFGFIMFIYFPLFIIQVNNVLKCKIEFVFTELSLSLLLIPMFSATLRVYYIYTNSSKVNFGNGFNNNRIFLAIAIILTVIVSLCLLFVFNYEFYIISLKDILEYRYPLCNTMENKNIFIINYVVISILVSIVFITINYNMLYIYLRFLI